VTAVTTVHHPALHCYMLVVLLWRSTYTKGSTSSASGVGGPNSPRMSFAVKLVVR
jgi:hypothetical protein